MPFFKCLLSLLLLFCVSCDAPPLGLYQTSTTKNVIFKHVEQGPLALDIVIPDNDQEKHGCVLWFHGGGWLFGSKEDSLLLCEFLASFGYVGVSADYRLLTFGASGVDIVEDADAALQFLYDHGSEYGIDVDRIGVGGDSAGGHLALMVGLRNSAKCIVAIYPPTDLVALDRDLPASGLIVRDFVGQSIEENLALWEELSPINYLNELSPPILLIHGTDDYIVPFSQSRRFHNRGQDFGLNINLISVEEAGHGWTIFPYSDVVMRTYPLIIDHLSVLK